MLDNALGAQLADGLLVDAFALAQCWQHLTYQRQRDRGILDQEVDKFSLLLFQALLKAEIRTVPIRIVKGRRGPGVALRSNSGRPIYICGIIEFFQSAIPSNHHLFSVTQSAGVSQYIQPLVRQVDWLRWKQTNTGGRHPEEPDFIENLGLMVREFTQEEVIALGRHCDHKMTVESLWYLIESFKSEFFAFLGDADNHNDGWREHLSESFEIAQVAYEKTTSDRTHYSNARQAVLRAHVTRAQEALLQVRTSADDIWEPDCMRGELVPLVARVYRFEKVVYAALALWSQDQDQPLPQRSRLDPADELQTALASWQSIENDGITIPTEELTSGRLSYVTSLLRHSVDRLIQRAVEHGV